MVKFTKREWCTLCGIAALNFATSICVALQAPFYPQEAESKGATATEYGMVFGIFELVAFLSSPLLGKYMDTLGAKFLLCSGVFLAGSSTVLFGTLDMVDGHDEFIGLSFAIRIVESVGSAAAVTASFSIVAAVFPLSVATTFATLEVLWGLGLIVGPTVGGLLFPLGGFQVPFTVVGIFLLMVGIAIFLAIPNLDDEGRNTRPQVQLLSYLKVTPVLLDALSITAAAIANGYYQAILEPHIRQFGLSSVTTGLIFIISGGMYAISAPLVGRLCDTRVYPKKVIIWGHVLIMISFLFVGPAPFIPIDTTLWMVCVGLLIQGVGHGCILVSAFIDMIRSSIACGLPNDITTYGVVSGLWSSSFSLGAFIGPSVAGVLYDWVGFRKGSLFGIAVQLIMLAAVIPYVCLERRPPLYRPVVKPEEGKCIVHLNPSWSQDLMPADDASAGNGALANGGGKTNYGAFTRHTNNNAGPKSVAVKC